MTEWKVLKLAKGKKNTSNDKQNGIDFGKIQNFLGSAISDISGYIKFSDTKVSIIMAAMGVIIAGIINCRNIIYTTYKLMPNCSLLQLLFAVILVTFLTATVLVYFWGLQTIKSHTCEIEFKSLWFIKEKRELYSFENYRDAVEKMTDKDIVDTMAAELYKLNDINKQKMKTMKKTIKAFSVMLIALLSLVLFCTLMNI